MTKDETLKMALEALQKSFPPDGSKYEVELEKKHREAIDAIKQALAQPVQEPVANAFMTHLYNFGYKSGHHDTVEGRYIDISSQEMDTYHSDVVSEWLEDTCITTPPTQREWVGLTGEEKKILATYCDECVTDEMYFQIYEGIEAKLKEKNT